MGLVDVDGGAAAIGSNRGTKTINCRYLSGGGNPGEVPVRAAVRLVVSRGPGTGNSAAPAWTYIPAFCIGGRGLADRCNGAVNQVIQTPQFCCRKYLCKGRNSGHSTAGGVFFF